ncbi:hypothetical protein LTR08_005123 [Meristemomyces frigidus]|nr:hypothetical protein LTR08_005123 [Meristemomyces frigidus]
MTGWRSGEYSVSLSLFHEKKSRAKPRANISHHLFLFPNHPLSTFHGFPTCTAKIQASSDVGYAATYGWIQMVREAPTAAAAAHAKWAMDPVPILADLNTPFAWFGSEAQLFDAPSRTERGELDWNCWSFLAYIEDSLLSRAVRPIRAFEWGFRIAEGGEVSIKVA